MGSGILGRERPPLGAKSWGVYPFRGTAQHPAGTLKYGAAPERTQAGTAETHRLPLEQTPYLVWLSRGYTSKSLFRLGLDELRDLLSLPNPQQWSRLTQYLQIAVAKSGSLPQTFLGIVQDVNASDLALHWPRELMLSRMLAADAHYDGAFITGVTSTGIYCLPSCRARKPKPENVVFCSDVEEARSLGLRACQRCRPDDFYAGVDVTERRIISALHSQPGQVQTWAKRANFSVSRLHELSQHYFHLSPADMLSDMRLQQAATMLLSTSQPVTEIAYAAGYGSLSAFGGQFRRRFGMTPSALRSGLLTRQWQVNLPTGYSVAGALQELGRDPQQSSTRVSGNCCLMQVWTGEVPIGIRLEFGDSTVLIHVDTDPSPHWPSVLYGLWRVLGLDRADDVKAFEARHNLTQRGGLHPHGTFDAFDAAVWAVCGQQVSFDQAARWRRQLLKCLDNGHQQLLCTARAKDVLALSADDWDQLTLSVRQKATLLALAQAFTGGELPLYRGSHSAPSLEKKLRAIHGVGGWTARYVLLRGYGFSNVFPEGDAALNSAVGGELQNIMAHSHPYRSLAAIHLWHHG